MQQIEIRYKQIHGNIYRERILKSIVLLLEKTSFCYVFKLILYHKCPTDILHLVICFVVQWPSRFLQSYFEYLTASSHQR